MARYGSSPNLITVPYAKYIRRLGKLSATQLHTVENAVRLWLGFDTGHALKYLGDSLDALRANNMLRAKNDLDSENIRADTRSRNLIEQQTLHMSTRKIPQTLISKPTAELCA